MYKRQVLVQPKQLIFERYADGERVLVAINADGNPFDAHFDAGCGRAVDLITGADHDFGGGSTLEMCIRDRVRTPVSSCCMIQKQPVRPSRPCPI